MIRPIASPDGESLSGGTMQKPLIFALALCGASISAPTWANDTPWHWVRVQPDNAPHSGDLVWKTCQGDAPIAFDGNHFSTMLACNNETYRIEGDIIGDSVTATETLLNSDASPDKISGRVVRHHDTPINQPDKVDSTELIELHGQTWQFVGFSRRTWTSK